MIYILINSVNIILIKYLLDDEVFMPGFVAWGAMLVGHYAVWSGKGGKVVANAINSIERFYDKNLNKKIKRLLRVKGVRKEVKITRNDENGVFKLKFDDVSIFNPSDFEEDAKFYNRNEDDLEIVGEVEGKLENDNPETSQTDKKIDYYTIELTLKDPNKLETLKLGEVDFYDWEKVFDIKIISKETGEIIDNGSKEYGSLLETLDNYAKFTASKGLPNDNFKDKVAVNNDTPIVGAFVNIWNAWIKGQIVKEKIDLEGTEDGNEHIKSLDFLESMGELLNDENEQEILDRYYKSVTRDLENQKRIMDTVRDKYRKEIQDRQKERNKAKLKLALIIVGSVLTVTGIIALAATVLPAAVGGTVAGSILTAVVGGIVTAVKGGIKSLFSFPIFGVATASLVAGIFTKGRSDYKKQRLENAIKNEQVASEVIQEVDKGIEAIENDKKQVLENLSCIKQHKEVSLDVNSPSFGICLPKLLENICLIQGLSIKGIDICQKNNKELIVKKLNNLLKQANLSADSKLTKLEFDCKFSDLSKENQEKLLKYAKDNFLFKEISFLEISDDNILEDNTFKELKRLCEINKYLSGDIEFDNGDYPNKYFASQEDWHQAILEHLENNYYFGVEGKFVICDDVIRRLKGIKFKNSSNDEIDLYERIKTCQNRNALMNVLETQDYDTIENKIEKLLGGMTGNDERLKFYCNYWRAMQNMGIMPNDILELIKDSKLLKTCLSLIEQKDKNQFFEYVGFNSVEQELLDGVLNLEDILQNEEKFSKWIENFIIHSDFGTGRKSKFWNEIIKSTDSVSDEVRTQIERVARIFISRLREMGGYSEIQKCFKDNALWFIRLITEIKEPQDTEELKIWLEKGDKLINVKVMDFKTNEEFVEEWSELKKIIQEKVNDMVEPKSIDELKQWLELGKSHNNFTIIVTKKIEKIVKNMTVSGNVGEEVKQWLMLLNEYPNYRDLIENKIDSVIDKVRIANINELKNWIDLNKKYPDCKALKTKIDQYDFSKDTLLDICSNWQIVNRLVSREQLCDKVKAALYTAGFLGSRYNSLESYFNALGKANVRDFLERMGFNAVEQYLFIKLSNLSDNQNEKISQKILEYMGYFFDWKVVGNKRKNILGIIESDLSKNFFGKDENVEDNLKDIIEKSKSVENGVKLFGDNFEEWLNTFDNTNRCLNMLSGVSDLWSITNKLQNFALSGRQKELLKQVLVKCCNELITPDNTNYSRIMELVNGFKGVGIDIVNPKPEFGEPILSWSRFDDVVNSSDPLSLVMLSNIKIELCVTNNEECNKMREKFKILFEEQKTVLDTPEKMMSFAQQMKSLKKNWLEFILKNQDVDENQIGKLHALIKIWCEVNSPSLLDAKLNEKFLDGICKGLGFDEDGITSIDEIIKGLVDGELKMMASFGNPEAQKILQEIDKVFHLEANLENK